MQQSDKECRTFVATGGRCIVYFVHQSKRRSQSFSRFTPALPCSLLLLVHFVVFTARVRGTRSIGFDSTDGVATAALMMPPGDQVTFEKLMKTTQDVRDYFGSNHPGLYGPDGPNEKVARSLLEQR